MTFRESHPWIDFKLRVDRFPYQAWVLLGEAQSKCEHLANVALKPELTKKLNLVYLAKGAQATTAIEGNTLTEAEVFAQVQGRLDVSTSREYLKQETQNIIDVCNELVDAIVHDEIPRLDVDRIKDFNRRVLHDVPVEEHVIPGQIRNYEVGVTVARYKGAPHVECEYLLKRLCDWLAQLDENVPDGVNREGWALLRAVLAHLYISWIHPFGDGNGRTARLIEYQILMSAGIPQPAAHLLSNHYNQTRTEYYRQLDYASKANGGRGDVSEFIRYAIQGFVDGIREQIKLVQNEALTVAWRNYVFDFFGDQRQTPVTVRRRRLVLALTARGYVKTEELEAMTPKLARAYATKSERVITRDLKWLREHNLVRLTKRGWRANKALMKAFMPHRAKPKPHTPQ